MLTKKAKKILSLVLAVCLVPGTIPLTTAASVGGICTHEHGEGCSYVEGAPCSDPYTHDETYGYIADEDDPATPSDAYGHDVDCGYTETVDCDHVCDADCGGLSLGDSGRPVIVTEGITVAELDVLPDQTLWQGYDFDTVTVADLILPDTLTGTDADGEPVIIDGVTWESDPDFDPAAEVPFPGYIFSPILPEGYALADDVTAPVITVFIRPAGGVQIMPMAVNTITSGTFANIYGNSGTAAVPADDTNASNNTLTIGNGGSLPTLDSNSIISICGGFAPSGTTAGTDSNNLTINGFMKQGTGNVVAYGGRNNGSGTASSNQANITSDNTNDFYYISGGDANSDNVTGNTVTIDGGGQIRSIEGGWTFSGNAGDSGAGNNVNITGGSAYILYGITGGTSNSGFASYNEVHIGNGYTGTVGGNIVGGWVSSGSGSAEYNIVEIDGGSLQSGANVIGGHSTSGIVIGNSVSISGGTVGGDIYGGQTSVGSATGNTVTITTTGNTYQNIYGGYTTWRTTGDLFTGNTLNLHAGNIITSVQNTETLNFTSGGSAGITTLDTTPTGAAGNPNVTINTDTNTVTFGGAITGTGGIEKTGTGALTLAGTNSFTGSTIVSEGTLSTGTLSGDLTVSGAGANVTVNGNIAGDLIVSDGTVTVTGTVSGTTTHTGGTLNIVATGGGAEYIITASADANGSISPSGSVTVNHGANQTFTITPGSYYSISDVKVDGVSVGAVSSYTFSNVTVNHTINATFYYSYSGGGEGGSSSGRSSSGSSSSGSSAYIWKQDEKGWWLEAKDGSYPKSAWQKVNGSWYYFDELGYMASGWQMIDGSWYYMQPGGAMVANNWVLHNGKWYFLNQSGAMLANTNTPDGCYVNEHGEWVP